MKQYESRVVDYSPVFDDKGTMIDRCVEEMAKNGYHLYVETQIHLCKVVLIFEKRKAENLLLKIYAWLGNMVKRQAV
jgi:hypothetical protein